MPWLRSSTAIILAAFLLALLDVGGQGPSSVVFVAGGLALLALPLSLPALIVQRIPPGTTAALPRSAALLILGLGPLLPLLVVRAETIFELSPLTLTALVVFPAVGVAVLLGILRLADDNADAASWTALACAALVGSALAIIVTLAQGNLIRVRPGYEMTHLLLFLGTWGGAFGLCLPLAWGLTDPTGGAEPRWVRPLLGAVSIAVALILLWADQNTLRDLYLWIHLWSRACATLLMASALGLLMPTGAVTTKPARVLVSALALSLPFFAFAPTPSEDIAFRSRVAHGNLGRSLLRLRPLRAGEVDDAPDPRLEFPAGHEHRLASPPRNLLLISVDTLRFDALADMPKVGAFAQRGASFQRAYSAASSTEYALPSIFYGRYVCELDWSILFVDETGTEFTPDAVAKHPKGAWLEFAILGTADAPGSLAQRLHDAGFVTSATIDRMLGYFARPNSRFAQWFDHYEALGGRSSFPNADTLVDATLSRIDAHGERPWFHWLHLFDPHESGIYDEKYDPAAYTRIAKETDASLGRLFEQLEGRGLLENTAVLLTADHGEALGEHDHLGHNSSLYEEQSHVPLILVVPGLEPAVVQQPVSTIDVAPTLAGMVGATLDGFTGQNLLAPALGHGVERPVFSERLWYSAESRRRRYDSKALIWGPHKLIWDKLSESLEFYDLERDPHETRSLVSEKVAQVIDLQGLLTQHVRRCEAAHPAPETR